jgi:hypothetical protein
LEGGGGNLLEVLHDHFLGGTDQIHQNSESTACDLAEIRTVYDQLAESAKFCVRILLQSRSITESVALPNLKILSQYSLRKNKC